MAKVSVLDSSGQEKSKLDLDKEIFGIEPNVGVMHQVVTAQLAAKRSGTHKTKTRAEKRGGGAKPWRQKGTGRARQGSIRAPHWKGGGVAHGPQPRSYAQKTPKKMKALALKSALSDRASESKVLVVNDWDFKDAPSTKSAVQKLAAIGAEGRVLVVIPKEDLIATRSFRNLEKVHILTPSQLNTYDVLVSDCIVFTKDSLNILKKPKKDVKADVKTDAKKEDVKKEKAQEKEQEKVSAKDA